MMMLTRSRAQFGRITHWVQTRYPSPYSVTMFKQCSSTRDPPSYHILTAAQFWLVTRWMSYITFPIPTFKPRSRRNFVSTPAEKRRIERWCQELKEAHYLACRNTFSIEKLLESLSVTFDPPFLEEHVIDQLPWNQTQHPNQCSSPEDDFLPFPGIDKELPEHVVHLTCQSSAGLGYCEVFLVGMLYDSKSSQSNVQAIINRLKPEVVFLEVSACELKTGELGIEDPALRAAYKEAFKCGGTVVPGDRPMEITQQRVWRKMPLSERINIFSVQFNMEIAEHMLWHANKFIADLDPSGNIDMEFITSFNQKLDEISPTFVETYIHERDLYMSAALLEEAKKRRCIVAVVGMSHLPGIKKHWEQPISIAKLQDLSTVPPIPIYFKCEVFLSSSVGLTCICVGVTCVCVTMLTVLAKMFGLCLTFFSCL